MNIALPSGVKSPGKLVVLVTGGRDFTDENRLFDMLDRTYAWAEERRLRMVLVQGGARGADHIARRWAWHNGVLCITERAQWTDLSHPDAVIRQRPDGSQYDAMAGLRRNQVMIDKYRPDICVAMPGRDGTADAIDRCRKAEIPVLHE